MQFLVENLIPEGSVQQRTQTQVGVTSLQILNTPAKPGPDEAGQSKEVLIDSTRSFESSDGPLGFTTPPPALSEKIDWGIIELPRAKELTRSIPFLKKNPQEFRQLMDTPRGPSKNRVEKCLAGISRVWSKHIY